MSPLFGSLFETFGATEVLKQMAALPVAPICHHWRSHAGAEVDLVMELDGKLWPLEFKAGTRISRHDTRGIAAFRATYPGLATTPGAIIAPVSEPYRLTPDIWVLPYDLE